ncbi:MAG: alpha/beta hydrolase [Rhodospirillaceae bacterium]|nr:alpha/beta hydrolase [Rhodospirillales bacterium]
MAARLSLNSMDLEYTWFGEPAAHALVFLHEGLGSVSLWRDFPARVAAATGIPALVFSRVGYGGSSPVALPRPLDYLEREARDVLPGVLDALDIVSTILMGHSDGASIALVHAAQDHGRVKGVVAMAPHTFVEDMCVAAIAQVTAAFESGDLRARLQRHHGSNVDCAFWGWNRAWLDPAFKAMDLRPYLPRIQVPVLVIQGEDDEYATLAQVDAVVDGVGGAVERLVLPQCGHFPHRDQADAVVGAIGAFVARL